MKYQHKSDWSEKFYILNRQIKAFLHGLVYYACRMFPIDQRKIVMWTFEGSGGYGCGPKYVAEELLKRNRQDGENYKIIWLLNDLSKDFPPEIKKIKNSLWNRAYHLSTAGTWISNTRTFYGTKKEENNVIFKPGMQRYALNQLVSTGEICFPQLHIWLADMIQN